MTISLDKPKRAGQLGQWLAIFGVSGVVVACTDTMWTIDPHGPDRTYADLQRLASDHAVDGWSQVYFAALGYLVLGAVALLALGATLPHRRRGWCAAIAVPAALAAAGLAAAATMDLHGAVGLGPAVYLTVGGYVLVAIACLVGVRGRAR